MSFLSRLFGGKRKEASVAQPPQRSTPGACPSCGTILETPPTRSRKCPACKERIVVRTRRSDRVKLILTEAEGKKFDEQRDREAARNDAIRRSESVGATVEDFSRTEKELTEKWGFAPPRDVFWAVAVKAALAAMEKRDWHQLSMVYWTQALLLHEEGKPHMQLAREASKASLQRYAEDGYTRSVQVIAGCCQLCDRDEGRRFTIPEALEELPIPHDGCERDGWCACMWNVVID